MFNVFGRTSELVLYVSCHGSLADKVEKIAIVIIILSSVVATIRYNYRSEY